MATTVTDSPMAEASRLAAAWKVTRLGDSVSATPWPRSVGPDHHSGREHEDRSDRPETGMLHSQDHDGATLVGTRDDGKREARAVRARDPVTRRFRRAADGRGA